MLSLYTTTFQIYHYLYLFVIFTQHRLPSIPICCRYILSQPTYLHALSPSCLVVSLEIMLILDGEHVHLWFRHTPHKHFLSAYYVTVIFRRRVEQIKICRLTEHI